jgi:hypothetical protein
MYSDSIALMGLSQIGVGTLGLFEFQVGIVPPVPTISGSGVPTDWHKEEQINKPRVLVMKVEYEEKKGEKLEATIEVKSVK